MHSHELIPETEYELAAAQQLRRLMEWCQQDCQYLSYVILRQGDEHRQFASEMLEVMADRLDQAEVLAARVSAAVRSLEIADELEEAEAAIEAAEEAAAALDEDEADSASEATEAAAEELGIS